MSNDEYRIQTKHSGLLTWDWRVVDGGGKTRVIGLSFTRRSAIRAARRAIRRGVEWQVG